MRAIGRPGLATLMKKPEENLEILLNLLPQFSTLKEAAAEISRANTFGGKVTMREISDFFITLANNGADIESASAYLDPLNKLSHIRGPETHKPILGRTGQVDDLVKLVKSSREITVVEIANKMDLPPYAAVDLIKKATSMGYTLGQHQTGEIFIEPAVAPAPWGELPVVEILPIKGMVKFAAIADNHANSKHEALPELNAFTQYAIDEECQFGVHAGDFVEGYRVYRGQEFEVTKVGHDDQIQYFGETFPKHDGFKWYIVGGNHDVSFHKVAGRDIGKSIKEYRDDIEYLGMFNSRVMLKNIVRGGPAIEVDLHHHDKANAYALCFDNETEILSREQGWVLFKNLEKSSSVATLNPQTQEFEWQKPYDYVDQKYRGKLIHFKARSVDMMVTPQHQMYVKFNHCFVYRKKNLKYPTKSHRKHYLGWQLLSAKEIAEKHRRQKWRMMKGARGWIGKKDSNYVNIPRLDSARKHVGYLALEDFVRLAGWFITEGCVSSNLQAVTICQCSSANPENHREIIELLKGLRIKYGITGRNGKDINVYSTELGRYLVSEFGRTSREKKIPTWIKELPRKYLKILFLTMIKGDGWKKDGKSFGYRSISPRLVGDVQEIAIKLGYGTTVYNDTVSLSSLQKFPTINEEPQQVDYDDRVYCVAVPNGIIMTRRNGRAVWSGNSYNIQKMIENYEGGNKPQIAIVGHTHQTIHLPLYRNVHGFLAGCFQQQTLLLKNKNIAPRLGGWIITVKYDEKEWIRAVCGEFVEYYAGRKVPGRVAGWKKER